ncbi:MAG: CoA transferase [Chloroflexi bacterium]|nr:CoA transferase [Chloroflexota bacterium]MYD16243.1 CoA transferase [Chloroflexota bacterium]MYJ01019.1 CoA transferase [Chloroflexota bacterium]
MTTTHDGLPHRGPLSGIRVLEFSQIIAGPFGCQNLADMGADVIKVEPPEGEAWRQFSQFMPDESKWFQSLNRGKRSLVLALREPEAQAIIHRLIPEIDVVVINYRPDVATRLGIDYDTLRALRPDLIYVDNTAFGRQGPWAQRPGYDIIAQAVSGLMASDGKLDDNGTAPVPVSAAVADYGTGIVIALGVCAALFHRQNTGEGQMVETTLLNTALAMQGSSVMQLPIADELPQAKMDQVTQLREEGAPYAQIQEAYKDRGVQGALNIYYRCYETRDGAVAIGALSASLWAKVREALETDFLGFADPELDPTDPEQFAEATRRVREIEAHVRSHSTEHWLKRFDECGVPSGPINFAEELADEPQVVANGMVVDLNHDLAGPQRQVGPLFKMSATPTAPQGSSPPLGRNTDEIVAGAGYRDEEIADFRSRGIIA